MVKNAVLLIGTLTWLLLISACDGALDSLIVNREQGAGAAGAVTEIVLENDTITAAGRGVKVDGPVATITSAGTYSLSGTLQDGQIVVDTDDREPVELVLNGVDLSSSSTAPLTIANAAETTILLAENTVNRVSDAADYQFPDAQTDEPNAAVFSKDNLTISGPGALIVAANYNDGIASKDGLTIAGGDITIEAVDDGMRGKDYLVVKDGRITITAQGDGLKSDEKDDPNLGHIALEGGDITVTSGGDALQAQTSVSISGGSLTLTAGGGSANAANNNAARGIRAGAGINIDGGSLRIDSAADAINSVDNLVINDGTFTLASGDDAIHADGNIALNGGLIEITNSLEGIEGAMIRINDGEFRIVAGNDGINAAGGGKDTDPEAGGTPAGGNQGQDTAVEYSGDHALTINGGKIVIDAGGDGIDSNGGIVMRDGVVLINGPVDDQNGALDYDGTFRMTGGYLVAAGSAAKARTTDDGSSQNALMIFLDRPQPAGTLIHIADAGGQSVLTFAPAKAYQSVAFSAPDLRSGAPFTIYYGGRSSGTAQDGLIENGTYSPGTELGSFTLVDTITIISPTP